MAKKETAKTVEKTVNTGFIDNVEALEAKMKEMREAQKVFATFTQEQVDKIFFAAASAANKMRIPLAKMAVEETGMGVVEDKVIKNNYAAEYIYNAYKNTKTVGVVEEDKEYGIKKIAEPIGLIAAVIPTTNPTSTAIFKTLISLKTRNAIIISPHPRAKKVSQLLVKMLNKALMDGGAPANLITMVEEPSIENTNRMIDHPGVRLLVATGGPAIVKKVLSSGKKAIGAGAGNPPVVVDETADIEKAAKDIVDGCSFDNNVPCIAEKEVFAVDSICDYLIQNMKLNGAYEIRDVETIERLDALVTNEKGGPKTSFVGKSAKYILDKLGVPADDNVKVIIMEVGKNHHLVTEEMMMPILPIVRVSDVDTAIEYAHDAEHGNRHTAMMHSRNVEKLSKMAKLLETTIFVKNAPSYAGIGAGGEGHTTFTIAGPTGEGLTSARSFCRKRRCVMSDAFSIR